MQTRKLGALDVAPIGLGAMNLAGGYSPSLAEPEADALLNRALDLGYTHIDTAAAYGDGYSERMIGTYLAPRRSEFVLATKWALVKDENGRRIDNSPARLPGDCEKSLRHLKTDVIDLYYLHRWDKQIPVEEVVGAMGLLVEQGKVRQIGLSEVSAATLRKAHAEHPIAAVQSEYSLWTRNPEIAVLETCREIGATFVAFSPLARQFLTGAVAAGASFAEDDLRYSMPRFQGETLRENLTLLQDYNRVAERLGCTGAQLAIAWTLARGDHVVPIPGTARLDHLEENIGAAQIDLDKATLEELDAMINRRTVTAPRYPETLQRQIDTEEFEADEA